MRTNVVIDEDLISEAMRVTGMPTKRAAVELGLQTLVRLRGQTRVRDYRGKLNWQGDLDAMRRDE